MHNITKLLILPKPETQFPTEVLLNSYPRYNSDNAKGAVKDEIQGLLQRSLFEFVDQRNVPSDANVLGGRFVLAIKQPGTSTER